MKTLRSLELARKLTKYVRSQGELFYNKSDDAKIDAFALGYLESMIGRMIEENSSVRSMVESTLEGK